MLGNRIAVGGIERLTDFARPRPLIATERAPELLTLRQKFRVTAFGGKVHPGIGLGAISDTALALPQHQRIHRLRGLAGITRRTQQDRKSTRLNSSHSCASRMPSSA